MGRTLRKLKWQHRLQKMGGMRLTKIARKVKWRSIQKGKRPLEWNTVVEKVLQNKKLSKKTLKSKNMGEFKEERVELITAREVQGLTREATSREGLGIYQRLDQWVPTWTSRPRHKLESQI